LSLMNAVLLGAPRIIFGIGRDGLFSRRATEVGASGTPRNALRLTVAGVAAFITSGKFDEIIAVTSVLLAVLYFVNYLAVFVLRVREPDLPRPFRAWGYPVTTGLVLVGSLLFLIAAIHDDHATALRAAGFLLAALPVYLLMHWRQQRALKV
jgi:basic amino acid/polyamine antiporter, APA family